MTAPMPRDEVLALAATPVITLGQLARVLGISEPTVRECRRNGDLERAGIRVTRFGLQYRIVTASVLEYLGLADGASTVPAPGNGAGQGKPVLRAVASGGEGSPGWAAPEQLARPAVAPPAPPRLDSKQAGAGRVTACPPRLSRLHRTSDLALALPKGRDGAPAGRDSHRAY